jgi:glutamate racemase
MIGYYNIAEFRKHGRKGRYTQMDKRPIGVFDSGLGGLTAVKKLMEVMPGEDIIYFGDTGRVPYGGRSKETITKYARQDIEFLLSFDIKAILVACGTVSTNALDDIADDYPVPVWGVVDSAARAAVSATKNGKIGIIGTNASIRSGAYDRKIKALMPEAEITERACPLFVPLVEAGKIYRDDMVLKLVAEEYLEKLRQAKVDTLILGCTHYPLISSTISDIMGEKVTLIDTGGETARDMARYLKDAELTSDSQQGTYRYFVSDSAEDFAATASVFLKSDILGSVEKVTIGTD